MRSSPLPVRRPSARVVIAGSLPPTGRYSYARPARCGATFAPRGDAGDAGNAGDRWPFARRPDVEPRRVTLGVLARVAASLDRAARRHATRLCQDLQVRAAGLSCGRRRRCRDLTPSGHARAAPGRGGISAHVAVCLSVTAMPDLCALFSTLTLKSVDKYNIFTILFEIQLGNGE